MEKGYAHYKIWSSIHTGFEYSAQAGLMNVKKYSLTIVKGKKNGNLYKLLEKTFEVELW